MSGIVGIVHLDGSPVDPRLLQQLAHCLSFRGPDAQEVWTDGAVGFGHALLRTTREAEGERQPTSRDGRAWITADARVDGRGELLEKLRCRGPRVSASASDAELILAAYEVWGEGCVEHLLGDFAFALWDGQQRRLFCARDQFGVKPFYYAQVGKTLVFSNTLDCVRAHPGVSAELNEQAIADFLLFDYNQELGTTAFAQIRRLPPGHVLVCSGGELQTRRYWSVPVDEPVRYRRAGEYVEHFRELLHMAVADRLRTDRAGVLMSGGLDSTSVAAVAKQVLAERRAPFDLRAYTVDYSELLADEESHFARLVADRHGIPIHFLSGASCGMYERWDAFALPMPEPMNDPLLALQHDQFKQVAQHGRVALTGDGGDVLLHGQSWPYLKALFQQRRFGRLMGQVGGYFLSDGRIPPLLGGFRTRLRGWLGQPGEQDQYPGWLNPALEKRLDLRRRWEELRRTPAPEHPTRPAAYAALTGPFWPSSHECQDPGVTGVPVEASSPFFDVRLARYLLSLPPIPWCADKKLLRLAMRGSLPETVLRRPKTPLGGDPLTKLIRRTGWRPAKSLDQNSALACYVDFGRLPRFMGVEHDEGLWLQLRCVSLDLWLGYCAQHRCRILREHRDEAGDNCLAEKALSSPAIASVR